MSSFFASLHYLALAIGSAGIILRGIALRDSLKGASLKRVFIGDNLWGVAAFLWIATGLMRAFGGLEKGTSYYMQNHWFYAKMGIFLLIFILEVWPMVTFIRWRIAKKSEITTSDHVAVRKFILINNIETFLVLTLPFFASLMARGGLIQ